MATSPSLLWFWEWLEFISIVIVGVGCWGEVWSEQHKFKPDSLAPTGYLNEWWKRFFWLFVVFGLAIELVAFGFSFLASNREIEGLKSQNIAWATKVEELRKATNEQEGMLRPRVLQFDSSAFRKGLKDKLKVKVEILYPKDDVESWEFSGQIEMDLISEGWQVSSPRPILEDDIPTTVERESDSNWPLMARMGVSSGGFGLIVGSNLNDPRTNPSLLGFITALSAGFNNGRYGNSMTDCMQDSRIHDNLIKLIIGSMYEVDNWGNNKGIRQLK